MFIAKVRVNLICMIIFNFSYIPARDLFFPPVDWKIEIDLCDVKNIDDTLMKYEKKILDENRLF